MLSTLTRFASAEIENLIKDLQTVEENYNSELRSRDREKLVIPIELSTFDKEFSLSAFSRDISSNGLGVITSQPFSAGSQMAIQMHLQGGGNKVRCQCRWNTAFGESFWASGWELSEGGNLDVQAIKDQVPSVRYDARSADRKRFSIPVVVRQKGKLPKINGFTRNISGEGVNIISSRPIRENSFCLIEFIRNNGERCEAIAKCVWTRKFGDSHWTTGWQFPRLERIAKFHAASFGRQLGNTGCLTV